MTELILSAAIVETSRGMIVVKEKNNQVYTIPNGTPRLDESIINAAVREVKEKTGLEAIMAKEAFEIRTVTDEGIHKIYKTVMIKATGNLHMIRPYLATTFSTKIENISFLNMDKLDNKDLNKYSNHVYAIAKEFIRLKDHAIYFSDVRY